MMDIIGCDYTVGNIVALRPFLRVLLIQVLLIQRISTTTPIPSEAPDGGLFLDNITETTATLTWKAPLTNESVSKYHIIYSKNRSEKYETRNTKSDITTVTLRKLLPCMEYKVVLTPRSISEEPIGTNSTLHFNTAYAAPPPVRELSATTITSWSLGVSWKQPETGCNITAYVIIATEVAEEGTESKQSVPMVKSLIDTAVVEGLQPYTNYNVTVTAFNEAGEGGRAFIIATTRQAVPSAPSKLEVTNKSPTAITTSWKEPKNINGVLGSYKVRLFRDGKQENETEVTDPIFNITALSPCVEYTVRVAATTGAGEGEYAEMKSTTSADPSVPCCSQNFNTKTILVTWSKPITSWNIIKYEVFWASDKAVVNSSTLHHTLNNSNLELSRICVDAVGEEKRRDKACCSQATYDTDETKGKSNIAGIIVGAVAALVVVVVLLAAFLKREAIQNHLCSRHYERESPPSPDRRRRSLEPLNDFTEYEPPATRRNWPRRAPNDVPMPELTPEEIGLTDDTSDMMRADNLIYSVYSVVEEYYSDLESRVQHQLEVLRNPATVAAEFDHLNKESFVGETSAGQLPVNMRKNRYSNIIPFDSNRVRLRNAPDNTTDYINASYVQSSVAEDVGFIACQSPKANTVSDFWWMVWEQNIRIIVMLVRSDEGEKTKCTQYWPVLCEQSFSSLVLKTKSKEAMQGGLIIRSMILKNDGESRTVRHFQFTCWPDFGVPTSENDLLMMVKEIREHIQPGMRNIVVHCSAGVGRTGTMIALWQLQVQAERRMPGVDVRQTVLELRRHREMLVQKPEQYYFLHSCFLKYLQEISIWKPTLGAAHFSEVSGRMMESSV